MNIYKKLVLLKKELQAVDKAPSASSAAPRQAQSLAVTPLPSIWSFLDSLIIDFFDKL